MSVRLRWVLLAAVGVLLVAATLWTMRGGSDDPGRVRGFLGPTPGPSRTSADYIETKKAYLDRQANADRDKQTAALVSFDRLVAAPDAQRMSRGMEKTFVWVRFPGSDSELLRVETTLAGAVADAAAELRKQMAAEIGDLEDQAEAASGSEREDLQVLVTERKDAYINVTAHCACVYAIAVEGAELIELRTLADQRVVRLVDVPDPITESLAGWELAPLVPATGRTQTAN